jgi:predicted metalloprotease
MRWRGRTGSSNGEDRRGMGVGLPVGGGIGGLVLLLIVSALTGTNPLDLISTTSAPTDTAVTSGPPSDEQGQFVSVVLKDTEDTWSEIFRSQGQRYRPPVLVLYSDATQTGCGVGQAVMGPFYCPEDQKVYLDLSFFRELDARFGAPGDFAEAYVVAHEVGHHVQTLLGLSDRVAANRAGASARQAASCVSKEVPSCS